MTSTEEKLTNVIRNIYELIQKSDKKIGELETHAGVSTGYLSRQNKEGVAKLSFEFVLKAAEFLEVSIDDLVTEDISQLTPDEKYLINVLNNLVTDTKEDELHWIKESKATLTDYEKPHILFEYQNQNNDFSQIIGDEKVYKSRFVDKAIVIGDAFRTNLTFTQSEIIVTCCIEDKDIISDDVNYFFEIYLVTNNEIDPLCCSLFAGECISKKIESLYFTIAESTKGIRVDNKVRGILDDYLTKMPF